MHYHAEVWLPHNRNVEEQIDNALAQFNESESCGFWDWYQIGGRWTGVHTGYDPYEDINNYEVCKLCKGTGDRDDWVHYDKGERKFKDKWAEECNGCNSCFGNGIAPVWTTDFQPYDGDIIPVSEISNKLCCHTLIIKGQAYHWEEWDGKDFIKTDFDGKVKAMLKKHGITKGYLVTVDYRK